MSEQRDQGRDPAEVEPTDNSSGEPADMNRVEEIEDEAKSEN
jgi:hypothetical protein